MDEHLRRLQREAAITGDYTKYDIALERLGQKRIVLRRLTVAEFAASRCWPDPLRIHITDWSSNNTFTIFIIGTTRGVDAFSFDFDFDDMLIGTIYKSQSRLIRILEIEHKTIITNKDWLVHPSLSPHKQDNNP